MAVLIACEESQIETMAFRRLGIEAYSCDIKPCSGGHPEWHIQGDARDALYMRDWDLVIVHPPCTYLSKAGAIWLYSSSFNWDRYNQGLAACDFFMFFYNYPGRIAIENPVPLKIFNLPPPSQCVQPFMFGDPFTKATYFWLHRLPPLFATDIVIPEASWTKITHGSTMRSKAFPGMAAAMSDQWGRRYCLNQQIEFEV